MPLTLLLLACSVEPGATEEATIPDPSDTSPVTNEGDTGTTVPVTAPELSVSPDPLDFGTVYVGCGSVQTLKLLSVGDEPLVIEEIVLDGDGAWTLAMPEGLPRTLSPGESLGFDVTALFEAERDGTATLRVTSNDPRGELTATLLAEGRLVGNYSDETETPEHAIVDLVMVVDGSCSMSDDRARLRDNLDGLLQALEDADVETWWTSPNEPCVTELGSNLPEGDDSVLAGVLAVVSSKTGACNSAVWREGATPILVTASDGWDSGTGPLDVIVADLLAFDANVVLSAIGPVGSRAALTAELLGGAVIDPDMKNRWDALQAVGKDAVDCRVAMTLTATPAEGTLEVTVDGVPQTTGWTLEEGLLRFDEPVGCGGPCRRDLWRNGILRLNSATHRVESLSSTIPRLLVMRERVENPR
jgi:hypothetical protein